jgi:hypothetical protein
MAKFRVPTWRGNSTPDTLGGCIDEKVNSSGDYGDGAIERVQAKQAELTRILGVVVDRLPDDVQFAIADELGFERED